MFSFPGKYVCVKCGHDLFSSKSKFEHSSPWPAFNETLRPDSLYKKPETATAFKVCKSSAGASDLNNADLFAFVGKQWLLVSYYVYISKMEYV